MSAVHGTLGKELVFKHYGDMVVVKRYPDMSKVKPSMRQQAQRQLLCELNAQYAQRLDAGGSLFHLAKKEFFALRKLERNGHQEE